MRRVPIKQGTEADETLSYRDKEAYIAGPVSVHVVAERGREVAGRF